MSQAFFGVPKLISRVGDIAAAEILEFTSLEQILHALLGIEFGCIPRQTFQVEPLGRPPLQKGLDLLGARNRRIIPNHQQLARNLAQQKAQETDHIHCSRGMILHLPEQSPLGGDGSNGPEMIARRLHAQDRCLSARCVGASRHVFATQSEGLPQFK